MGAELPLTSTERSARRRAALRAKGLRPRTFWLPDPSTPEFKAEAARVTALIDAAAEDAEMWAWVDAISAEVLAENPPPDGWA
jgi:hypothetical protein